MIYIPNEKMWTNRFVHVELPTKGQIFSRTGQRAVSPSGLYTKDEPANFGKTPTMSAAEFLADVEGFEPEKADE